MEQLGICVVGAGGNWNNGHQGLSEQREHGNQKSCFCYSCCPKCYGGVIPDCTSICDTDTSASTYCPGPSVGCVGTGAKRHGCFGMNLHGHTGDCICADGSFSHPEKYKVGGVIVGLEDGMDVVLELLSFPMADATAGPIGWHAVPGRKATSVVKFHKAGPFEMPYLLPVKHSYIVRVIDTHLDEQPTDTLACSIANGATGDDTRQNDIMNIQVNCKPTELAKAGAAGMQREERMFRKLKLDVKQGALEAPHCEDAPVFLTSDGNMKPQQMQQALQATRLPCKRRFTMYPRERSANRMFVTEMRGHSCVQWAVETDVESHICFVPAEVYLNLGARAVLRDPILCPCQGTVCHRAMHALQTNTTYLLWVSAVEKEYSIMHDQPVHVELTAFSCATKTPSKSIVLGGLGLALLGIVVYDRSTKTSGNKARYTRIRGI
eukprot:g1852.t1